MSLQVKSHIKLFPWDQGNKVSPSGLLKSVLTSPGGSRIAGIWANPRALFIMSFACEWRECVPFAFLQLNPWRPSSSTSLPHWQVCGWHRGVPSLNPQATLRLALSIFCWSTLVVFFQRRVGRTGKFYTQFSVCANRPDALSSVTIHGGQKLKVFILHTIIQFSACSYS